MLWKPAALPPSVRSLRTALRASFRIQGVEFLFLPHELGHKEWDVVVQNELPNGLLVEEELVYPLQESEVKEHSPDIMQLVGSWLHHLTTLTEHDFE